MFYLVDKSDALIREHASKMALRRVRRKNPKKDSLRILEGKTLKDALKASNKVVSKKPIVKVDTKKVKETNEEAI